MRLEQLKHRGGASLINPNDYGWEEAQYSRIYARVKLRETNPHTGSDIRPVAKQLDGYEGRFMYCWRMDEGDPYPDEVAFSPAIRDSWPDGAPGWIASGDLELIANLKYGVDYGVEGEDDE